MKLLIEPLSQRDIRWGNKNLGTSAVKIKTSGCVITSLSMLCTYYKHSVTPDQLNDLLVNINGFSDSNLMKWESLPLLFPDIQYNGRIDCPDTPAPLDKVDFYLNKMMPVVALVDFDPAQTGLQQHFVLIIGKENEDYFINDPWTGECYYFSAKYGNPVEGICGLRLYTGPVIVEEDVYSVLYKGQILGIYETNPIDTIDSLNKQLESVKETLSQEIQNNATLQATLTMQEKDNAQLLADKRQALSERDIAIAGLKEAFAFSKDILNMVDLSAPEFRKIAKVIQDQKDTISKLQQTQGNYEVVLKIGKSLFVGKRK